ncbi:hypothetical protein LTR86_005091 [Recurvomyces mirabilis]|nr:hypothetical protein LTR86_005091 [Recurvomyces mirabilis]
MAAPERPTPTLATKDAITSLDSNAAAPSPVPDTILRTAYRKIDISMLTIAYGAMAVIAMGGKNLPATLIMNADKGTGIKHQLGNLSGEQFAWLISVANVSHFFLEGPSTIIFKRVGPRKYMTVVLLSWGMISMCQAATHNFIGLLMCRVMLGIVECGIGSSILFGFTFYYPAKQMTMRVAGLASFLQLSGILSSALAFAATRLNGVGGLAGWRWLMLFEGGLGVLVGLVCMIAYPRFPESASFLTKEQREAVLAALPPTQPHADDGFWDWPEVKKLLSDPLTYLFFSIVIFHAWSGPLYTPGADTSHFPVMAESANTILLDL